MGWPAVVAAGVAATGATGNGALSYYTDKNLHRQAQADTQKNMVLASHLEQQSIRNYTSNLRAAGLNPALATGAQPVTVGSPASPVVAGSGRFDYSGVAPALLEGLGKEEQIENVVANTNVQKAQEEKLKAEKNEIEQNIKESQSRVDLNESQSKMLASLTQKYGTEQLIMGTQYQRMLSQDSVVHHSLMDYCNRRLAGATSEAERDYWNALLGIGRRNKFDSGSVMAMSLFGDLWNSLDEYETQMGARAILRQIQDIQSNDNELLDVISHMPMYQAALVFGQTAEAYQNASFRKAYRMDLLPKEREKLEEDVRVQKHNDPAGMLKDGDLLGFGIYTVGEILRFSGDVIKMRQIGNHVLRTPKTPSVGEAPKSSSPGDAIPSSTIKNIRKSIDKQYPNANEIQKVQMLNQRLKSYREKMNKK